MAVKAALGVQQRQGLALTPAMRQSLYILGLPAPDLAREIAREAQENPFLLVDMPQASASSAYDMALDTVADRPSLGEDLRRQIGAMPLPDDQRAMALYLTGELRDDGYFDSTIEEVAGATGVTPELVEAGLQALQRCEPAGVGARDLSECLTLQLIDGGLAPDLAARVIDRIDMFAEARWALLAEELGLGQAAVRALEGRLRALTPRPVEDRGPDPAPLVPDLVLEQDPGGGLSLRLARHALPAVALDDALLARMPNTTDPFVVGAKDRAEALIRAVRARGETLLRIGARLAHDQHRFFTGGPDHLAPLSRRKMAADLGLHPSTLGRAVAGKAIAAGGALYPLAMFFPSALPGADGRDVSSFAVKLTIRRLVESEPSEAPLSDAAICARLHEDGVDITRRCVAKYRGCMRIPPSFERRRRKAQAHVQ